MSSEPQDYDAIVIGGGFYGCTIACYLAKEKGFKKVLLIERESQLLKRASYTNQARVHNGYHYPRSYTTAFRSRINLPRFARDWPDAIKSDFTKLYAIARKNSKVTSSQFLRFCKEIGAEIAPASSRLKGHFNPRLVEDVFQVREYAFDSEKLRFWAEQELRENGVSVRIECNAISVDSDNNGTHVLLEDNQNQLSYRTCKYLFNCTYSGLNRLGANFEDAKTLLKHEVTEMALIRPPSELKDIGITVMDGPFFSLMPFPPRDLHTLSHVRYTPHYSWIDDNRVDPYLELEQYDKESRHEWMLRDVARYMPSIAKSDYVESMFEVKTVLVKNEGDDGRPILFEKKRNIPGAYSILGGKIDNIYDIIEKIDSEFP